jgi:hypothetical protein
MYRVAFLVALLVGGVASAKPAPTSPPPLPTHVEKVDALSLELATVRLVLAQKESAEAQRSVAELGAARDALIKQIADKYKLDPKRDKYDDATLEIRRAPAPAK